MIRYRDQYLPGRYASLIRPSDNFVRAAPIRGAVRVYFAADFAYHRRTSHNFLE